MDKPVYAVDGLTFIPPFLAPDFTLRRNAARENVIEILLADLGDTVHKSPYLVVSFARLRRKMFDLS